MIRSYIPSTVELNDAIAAVLEEVSGNLAGVNDSAACVLSADSFHGCELFAERRG